jgi:hypothetical protein
MIALLRFRISLRPERGKASLPYSYKHALSSAIFSFLALGRARIAPWWDLKEFRIVLGEYIPGLESHHR